MNPALQRTSGDTGDWGYPSSYDTTYEKTYKGSSSLLEVSTLFPVFISGGNSRESITFTHQSSITLNSIYHLKYILLNIFIPKRRTK